VRNFHWAAYISAACIFVTFALEQYAAPRYTIADKASKWAIVMAGPHGGLAPTFWEAQNRDLL